MGISYHRTRTEDTYFRRRRSTNSPNLSSNSACFMNLLFISFQNLPNIFSSFRFEIILKIDFSIFQSIVYRFFGIMVLFLAFVGRRLMH